MTRQGVELCSRTAMFQARHGCTYLIYYRGDVSIETGSVIIRYQLPDLIENVS